MLIYHVYLFKYNILIYNILILLYIKFIYDKYLKCIFKLSFKIS